MRGFSQRAASMHADALEGKALGEKQRTNVTYAVSFQKTSYT